MAFYLEETARFIVAEVDKDRLTVYKIHDPESNAVILAMDGKNRHQSMDPNFIPGLGNVLYDFGDLSAPAQTPIKHFDSFAIHRTIKTRIAGAWRVLTGKAFASEDWWNE